MRWRWCVGLVGLLGCGDAAVADPDGGTNRPPAWGDAPASLELGEGQRLRLRPPANDEDGDPLSVAAEATGVEVAVDDGEVVVRAPYGASEGLVTVTLGDGLAEATVSIPVTVTPLSWETVAESGGGPEAREHPALVLDEARHRLLVLGGSGYMPYLEPLGDGWAYDLGAGGWTELAVDGLPAGGSRRVALASDTEALLHGGYEADGRLVADLLRVRFDTEQPTVETVEQADPVPAARALHAFFRDPTTDTYWAWGGLQGFAPTDRLHRMRLDGGVAQWTPVETAEAPSPRYGFFYAFDPERGHLTIFSGAQSTAMDLNPAQDIWRLDVRAEPPTWTRLSEDAAAPGRRNGVFAFDSTGPRMWVFGGTADAMTTEPGLWAIDTITGAAEQVTRDGEPPLRSSGAGIFDPVARQIVLGFGNSSSAAYADLQALQL